MPTRYLLNICLLVSSSILPVLAQQQIPARESKRPAPVLEKYRLRYAGPRWSLLYGSYVGVEEFALNELQRMVQRFVPYIVEVRPSSEPADEEKNLILVGTRANNRLIAELAAKGLVALPSAPQGYTIACVPSPWKQGFKVAVIAGTDASGVLYGVVEFSKRLAKIPAETSDKKRVAFDQMAEFKVTKSPGIA